MFPPTLFRYNKISEYINTPSISGTEDFDVINLSKDFVPAIFCPNSWPHAAEKWITRKRTWPKLETIKEICDSGFHLVCKASAAGDINKEWRLSFSIAENYLIDSLTAVQRTVYKIFKDMVKSNTTFISSYLLKTVFFWACESRPNWWIFENMDFYLEGLLLNLYHGLGSGEITHYFLEYNLLQDIPSDKLKVAALEVKTIMDQTEVCTWNWKFEEECDLFNLYSMLDFSRSITLFHRRTESQELCSILGSQRELEFLRLETFTHFISDVALLSLVGFQNKNITQEQLKDIENGLNMALDLVIDVKSSISEIFDDYRDLVEIKYKPVREKPTKGPVLNPQFVDIEENVKKRWDEFMVIFEETSKDNGNFRASLQTSIEVIVQQTLTGLPTKETLEKSLMEIGEDINDPQFPDPPKNPLSMQQIAILNQKLTEDANTKDQTFDPKQYFIELCKKAAKIVFDKELYGDCLHFIQICSINSESEFVEGHSLIETPFLVEYLTPKLGKFKLS